MKKYIFLFAAMGLLGTACMKDIGNYDYKEINEGWITMPANVSGLIGDTLIIAPEVKFTQDGGDGSDTSRYSYRWVVQLNTNNQLQIANTRIFRQRLDNIGVGVYASVFYIKDKQTGITFEKRFSLTVTTPAYEGWMVLGALGDSSRLDMLAYNGVDAAGTRMYTDVLTEFNTDYPRPIGKPLGIYTAAKASDYLFFISTTNGTNSLDRNTLKWAPNKRIDFMSFGTIPANFAPQLFWSVNTSYYMFDQGNIYTYTNATLFNLGAPANHVNRETAPFKASKFFNVGTGGSANLLMFDEEKRRFARLIVRSQGADPYASLLNTLSGARFDFSDVKMDLAWMSRNVFAGNVYAVFKNDAGEFYFSIFNPTTSEQSVLQKMNTGNDFDGNNQMVVDPTWATLYYSKGSKLYAYLPDANREIMLQDFGEKITFLLFPNNVSGGELYAPYRGKLMVATFDAAKPATGGTLRFFSTFNQGATPQITATTSHGGFAEIVGAAFRSRGSGF